MFGEFKAWLQDDTAYTALLLCLIGVVSFGLGRLSVEEEAPRVSPAVTVTEAALPLSAPAPSATAAEQGAQSGSDESGAPNAPQPVVGAAEFVGSKNGSKYHLPWCPGAQQMNEENKIFFASKEEAEARGYAPAANCPGL